MESVSFSTHLIPRDIIFWGGTKH